MELDQGFFVADIGGIDLAVIVNEIGLFDRRRQLIRLGSHQIVIPAQLIEAGPLEMAFEHRPGPAPGIFVDDLAQVHRRAGQGRSAKVQDIQRKERPPISFFEVVEFAVGITVVNVRGGHVLAQLVGAFGEFAGCVVAVAPFLFIEIGIAIVPLRFPRRFRFHIHAEQQDGLVRKIAPEQLQRPHQGKITPQPVFALPEPVIDAFLQAGRHPPLARQPEAVLRPVGVMRLQKLRHFPVGPHIEVAPQMHRRVVQRHGKRPLPNEPKRLRRQPVDGTTGGEDGDLGVWDLEGLHSKAI